MVLLENIFTWVIGHFTGSLYVIFLILLHLIAEPERWIIYTSAKGVDAFRKYLSIFFFSYMASYTVPLKLGIPFRVYLLNKHAGLELKRIMSILAADGFLYYLAWFLAACISLYVSPEPLTSIAVPTHGIEIITISALVLLLAVLVVAVKRKRLRTAGVKRARWIIGVFSLVRTMSISCYVKSSVIIFLDIAGQVLRHYFLLNLIGIDLSLTRVILITTLAVVAGMASMMPMGILGYDATVVLLLKHAHIGLEEAILVPILNRAFSMISAIILGMWGAFTLGYTPMKGIRHIRALVSSD